MNSLLEKEHRSFTFFICLPDSRLVGILAFLGSSLYKGSKEFAVGVVVSAFLFTPFLSFAGCDGGITVGAVGTCGGGGTAEAACGSIAGCAW